MFYETEKNDHGLPHDPFNAIIAPRPIGWIGTKGRDGSLNLAPYSFFNALSYRPKLVMFASTNPKDSLRNCEETGVFTASLVSRDLVEAMNVTSAPAPYGMDEFKLSGLTPVTGRMVDAPYVGEAKAVLECRVTQILRPLDLAGQETTSTIVFGQVVGIHIDDTALKDGLLDMGVARAIGRLGYMDYADASGDVFTLQRPLVL